MSAVCINAQFLSKVGISAVRFSCPICPTAIQFTAHHHSTPSTNHAAPHCAVLFNLLLLCLSLQNKYLPQSLFQHNMSVFSRRNTNTNTHKRTQFCVPHKYVLLCEFCAICMNSCIRYTVQSIRYKPVLYAHMHGGTIRKPTYCYRSFTECSIN